MSKCPRIPNNNATKPNPLQGQIPPELGHIAKLLNFTPLQMLAFELVADFDGVTVERAARAGILLWLDGALESIDSASHDEDEGKATKTRARKILETVMPHFKYLIDSDELSNFPPGSAGKFASPETVHAINFHLKQAVQISPLSALHLDVCQDHELNQVAALWPAAKRRYVAEKLARWIVELRNSADLMDGQSILANVN
jgi:hypothetical protein